MTSVFQFGVPNVPLQAGWIAMVRPGLATKHELFVELFVGLRFPGYFGFNWDALDECIRDLEWLPSGPVVLIHQDLPLETDLVGQGIYLSILAGAIDEQRDNRELAAHQLVVIFPQRTEVQIIERLTK